MIIPSEKVTSIFEPFHEIFLLNKKASSEGSDKPAQLHSLVGAFAVSIHSEGS